MERYNIFDFDGTIADSMYVWADSAPALLHQLGRTPKPDLTGRLAHLNMADSLRWIQREYELPQGLPELTALVMGRVEEEYLYRIQPKAGVRRVLDSLRAADCRCGIATNSDTRLVQAALERMGLAGYFEFVLSSRPGLGKDKPDLYLAALARLGGRDPAQAAVFEDSPRCLLTAVQAKFQVYALRDKYSDPLEYPQGLRACLDSWAEWSEEL